MAQKGFFFNMETCIGCKTCQIACKDKNDLQVGLHYREILTVEGGEFPKPWIYHISMSCNHCEIPVCVENCPVGAMNKNKDNGVVDIDKKKCVGCQRCVKTCPYGAPKYLESKAQKVGKCNMCIDLVKKGEEPACVASCPMRSLHFGDLKNLIKNYGVLENIIGLPDYNITRPLFTVKTKKYSIKNP